MKTAIIIPVLNPDEKMTAFIDSLVSSGLEDIIIVNDGSKEDTLHFFDEAKVHPGVTVLTHEVNKGKGRALKTAFGYLAENRKDIDCAVTADADGQHNVDSIRRCLDAFEQHPACVIIGGRNFSEANIPARSRFGNKVSSVVYRLACGIKLKDTQTGLRIIPAAWFDEFTRVSGERYEYETNMLIALVNKGIPYMEVPIETIYIDDNASSHFNPIKDSIKIYAVILKYFIKFLASSLASWLVDIGVYTLAVAIFENKVDDNTMEIIATVSSRVISSIVNYIINRKVVFKATDNAAQTTWRYFLLALCQMAVSYGLVYGIADALLHVSGLWHTVVKCVVDGCLFLFSYGIQRKWVFKHKKN
ncbi:MAG: bifunctional glycosyltransferase family 2/GtrA family protein [Lachnospiraceae bacterium]|nr:bifunctional glycosyltransferase family 2/GtrA family protein [Lachnospiraceae bacterium]